MLIHFCGNLNPLDWLFLLFMRWLIMILQAIFSSVIIDLMERNNVTYMVRIHYIHHHGNFYSSPLVKSFIHGLVNLLT